jgi:hypothetical protein
MSRPAYGLGARQRAAYGEPAILAPATDARGIGRGGVVRVRRRSGPEAGSETMIYRSQLELEPAHFELVEREPAGLRESEFPARTPEPKAEPAPAPRRTPSPPEPRPAVVSRAGQHASTT